MLVKWVDLQSDEDLQNLSWERRQRWSGRTVWVFGNESEVDGALGNWGNET